MHIRPRNRKANLRLTKTRDPMARDLLTPKYRSRVVASKKHKAIRGRKHKS